MALESLRDEIIAKLPEMRTEHERLGKLIAAAEAFANIDEAIIVADEGVPRHAAPKTGVIRSDEFFGMNTHQAVKAFLTHMGKGSPQSPAAISKALVDGGQSSDAEKMAVNVSSALKRMGPTGTGEVVQVKRGQWGLASWYGAGAGKKKDTAKPQGNGGDTRPAAGSKATVQAAMDSTR